MHVLLSCNTCCCGCGDAEAAAALVAEPLHQDAPAPCRGPSTFLPARCPRCFYPPPSLTHCRTPSPPAGCSVAIVDDSTSVLMQLKGILDPKLELAKLDKKLVEVWWWWGG